MSSQTRSSEVSTPGSAAITPRTNSASRIASLSERFGTNLHGCPPRKPPSASPAGDAPAKTNVWRFALVHSEKTNAGRVDGDSPGDRVVRRGGVNWNAGGDRVGPRVTEEPARATGTDGGDGAGGACAGRCSGDARSPSPPNTGCSSLGSVLGAVDAAESAPPDVCDDAAEWDDRAGEDAPFGRGGGLAVPS